MCCIDTLLSILNILNGKDSFFSPVWQNLSASQAECIYLNVQTISYIKTNMCIFTGFNRCRNTVQCSLFLKNENFELENLYKLTQIIRAKQIFHTNIVKSSIFTTFVLFSLMLININYC